MYEPTITLVGHVGSDPTLRVLQSGVEVVSLRVAVTPRKKDKDGTSWVDDTTLWFTVTAWRALATHVAESLHKGDRVVVEGRLSLASWERDGETRTSLEVQASAIGLDLGRAPAGYLRRATPGHGDPGERPDPLDDPFAAPTQREPQERELDVAV